MVRVTLGFRVRVRVSLGLGSSRVSVLAIVRCGALSYGGCELWSWLTLAAGTSCITWSSNTRALSSLSKHSTRVCMTERSVLLTPPRRLWCHRRLFVCYHDYTTLFISILTVIFPGCTGLAGFIRAKDDSMVVITGAVRRAKLRSNRHHQQTPSFLQARCPSFRPANNVKALKGKYHIPQTCSPQAHLWSSNFVFDHY